MSTEVAFYCLKSNSKKIEVCGFMLPRLSLFLPHEEKCGPKGKREDEVIKRTRSSASKEPTQHTVLPKKTQISSKRR